LNADVILVGGGLAGSLIAWRLQQARPDLRLCVLEQGPTLGGQHIWSFFESDVEADVAAWLAPLIAHRWTAYTIAFPKRARRLPIGYASITAERLHAVIAPALGESVRYGARAAQVAPDHVVLEDGTRIDAPLVLDGRGPVRTPELVLGWQKFVGLEVTLAEPHGLTEPVIMDATVDQHDGYRSSTCCRSVRSGCTSRTPTTATGPRSIRRRSAAAWRRTPPIMAGASSGWSRRRKGVLPIALAGDIDAFWRAAGPTPRVGLRAALFHPTTGYSLPDAARLADHIVAMAGPAASGGGGHNGGPPLEPPLALTSAVVRAEVEAISKAMWRERAFFRMLNRMMFGAAKPDRRYRVLERFYGLPEPLIRRFYAANMTRGDKARLLVGKPPVPISAALRCLPERGFALKDTA
jgi:lycopene beta-cyclase